MIAAPLKPKTGAIVALAAACLFAAGTQAMAAPPHKVMMVLWRGCEDACRGFQEYLQSKDLAVEFVMRDVKQDASALPGLVAEARSLDVDLVVTWGTTATLGIVGEYDKADPAVHLTDIPVLFMIVTDPLEARIVRDLDRPGRNVSGTLYLVPEDVQMRAIRSYLPFDKLGMIYNTNEVNSVISTDKIRSVAAGQGFQLVTRAVPNDTLGRPMAESLPKLIGELAGEDVDLIYIGSSSFIVLNRDVFTAAAVERGIPVAAAGEVAVLESDALMGLVSRYHSVGQLTAARAEEVLADGKKPAEIAVESLSRFSFIVNMDVARRLGRYPPMTLLNIAEVIKAPEGESLMRILLCSKRDLTSVVILNDLLNRLRRIPDCVVYLMLAERTRKVETIIPELAQMKVFERDLPFNGLFPLLEGRTVGPLGKTPEIEKALALCDMPADAPGHGPVPPGERLLTLNRLVERHRIPFQVIYRVTDNSLRVTTEAFAPDLILSVRFSFIFPPSFIALPRFGVINVHPGTVPGYAGLYPHFYSMLAGEKTLGCTVHFVDDGIDSGAVLATGEIPIDRDRSAFGHNLASHLLGNRLLMGIVEQLAAGKRLRGVLQDRSRLRHHTYPTPEDFAAFEAKGLSLIDIGEYLGLLRRFGLFKAVPAFANDQALPEPRDSTESPQRIEDKLMFDLGIFTVPAVAALAVFVTALFTGEEIVIDKIQVSNQLEWSGYTTVVATRQLSDELRELGVNAASELTGIEIDETSLEKGVEAFEDYFEISSLINGTRNLFGMIPFYINGEITQKGGEAVFIARVYVQHGEEETVKVVIAKGDPKELTAIMHEGALGILEEINPYIVALYYRQTETAEKQFDFPKTRAAIDRYLESRPVDEHFLAYGLLGRMYMLKAERDTTLTPEAKEAEYETAMKNLHAALRQNPDFLYPLINVGLIHAARGEFELAERYYARAVEVNPDYPLTRRTWGDMLVRQGRVHDAIIQYVAAVELEPENDGARDKLAGLYMRAGRPDAARDQWEEALLINPTNTAYAENLKALGGNPSAGAEEKCGPGLVISCY